VAVTDDKKRGRLNIISHLLSQVPDEPLESPEFTLPERTVGDDAITLPVRMIPTPF
jgi:hypothetical protein